jgi:hypothetical protein
MKLFIAAFLLLQLVACQLKVDLNFQRFSAESGGSKVQFGIALPDGPSDDFIAQIVGVVSI